MNLDALASKVHVAGRAFRRPALQIVPHDGAVLLRIDDRQDAAAWCELVLSAETLATLTALASGADGYGDYPSQEDDRVELTLEGW